MNMAWMRLVQQVREGDGEGGGSGGGAGDPAGGSSQGLAGSAAGGDVPPPPDPGAPYAPDGLPEQFRGKDERETIDRLWGDINGRPKAPETADAYTLSLPKDIAPLIDVDNDALLPEFRVIAKELGLTQDQYEGTITKLYSKMIEKGLVEKPLDIDAEFAAISDGTGDRVAQVAAGRKSVVELVDVFDGLAARQQISKDAAAELTATIDTAARFKALSEIAKLIPKQEAALATGGQPSGELTSEHHAERRMYPTMFKTA